jgi:hypothetical protein
VKVDEEKLYGWGQVVLAVLVVGTACAIAVAAAWRGQSLSDIPSWLAGAIGIIIGFFYGQTSAQKFRAGVSAATNGMLDGARKIAAAQVAQAQANGSGAEDGRAAG